MNKNFSAKYYQENKERLSKKFVKNIKIFLMKKKKKKNKMVVNVTKIFRNMKKMLVAYKKKHYRMRGNTLL